VLRDLRLRALAEDAAAFAATHAEEAAFGDGVWQQRAAQGAAGGEVATFVARIGGAPAGLAVGRTLPVAPQVRELVSMWTAPEHRRHGVGAALVDAVAAWAGDAGAQRLVLWVMRGNGGAEAFYERLGFVDADDAIDPSDPCRGERRMARSVSRQ